MEPKAPWMPGPSCGRRRVTVTRTVVDAGSAHVGRRADAAATLQMRWPLCHVWTSRRVPASSACMCGAHARRRSASVIQGHSFLLDGVRALIVVVTTVSGSAAPSYGLSESRPMSWRPVGGRTRSDEGQERTCPPHAKWGAAHSQAGCYPLVSAAVHSSAVAIP